MMMMMMEMPEDRSDRTCSGVTDWSGKMHAGPAAWCERPNNLCMPRRDVRSGNSQVRPSANDFSVNLPDHNRRAGSPTIGGVSLHDTGWGAPPISWIGTQWSIPFSKCLSAKWDVQVAACYWTRRRGLRPFPFPFSFFFLFM